MNKETYEAPWNFSWIIPGILAGSSYPQTISNLHFLKEEGISHLVTLSPDHIPPNTNFPGIKWTYIPIEEFKAPTLDDMNTFIELCTSSRDENKAIAVHCRAGWGRTGTMVAIYFVKFLNMSPDSAITKIRMMRPWSVETYEQEKAVALFRDYLRSDKK
ncbi:hypothetical protein ABEB36_002069 [Hypothenemus hampei]|uniref:Dual specificity protein phosphatase 23 n=1 Tax=Hypothenemus hampei TaxID=57062 RepID=A0ABD1F4G6_HYPHA